MGALALVGCGDSTDEPPAAATPEPTFTSVPESETPAPPNSGANAFIGSIAVDPADGTLFLGTGLGLYTVDGKRQKRVTGELTTPEGSGSLSSNLVVRFNRPGELLGSGHPEGEGSLPENLGLIRSTDGGKTWESVSALGESDFHILQVAGDHVVGVHAEDPDVQVSTDGGRTFERRTPPAPPEDVVVDPADPARMVATTAQGTFTSADGGGSWRQRDPAAGGQLEWTAPDRLYRSDVGGTIMRSADGGETWEEVGAVDTTVNELASDREGALYASVPGGEVRRSTDGGATWKPYVKLR
jgi:BNR/Asp-box repeat